ncbi:MAG: archaetidylinositol phosphate synthase [Methanobacterium formicicum]|jgi:archaetidylinositol phosphate synthase|uniref:Archaetidylinositol phosphate synthase n=1 Tax=Methanobacterium formicicum TaxID=2162 RepID=A0A089Z9J6_METFO|nr:MULTISPECIES: archaetidylinositol phosphate synthase [Methanobacterium]AIS31456.1 phosphatidylglycerophosphate synthase PgsA1 [Methanobacterium formicicum]AXV40799.1 MAG: phosphatidylglycerophosphate synthase [Methanobacterium sp. BAmetb5]MDD4811282.1 archaetidylinositol phosphate synthase [Methanobacterium formicicum]MDG3547696.1 archaetidylinositol phosphate synthase [Methanobacterium formicicum]MDH2658303.1 archaetidylinositol phosphate synthase [Methanobacterium formicicum]
MLNKLRPQFQRLINPLAGRISLHPNILTVIGLLVSLFAAYAFARGNLLAGGLLILLSGFFDVIDGAVARNNNTKSKFGGFLDSTCDRFADAFIIIGIIYGGFVNWFWGILALLAALSVSYIRARAEVEGIKCDVGIAERAERLFIILGGAFIGYFTNPQLVMTLAILLIVVLGYITVLQRIYHSWKELKNL